MRLLPFSNLSGRRVLSLYLKGCIYDEDHREDEALPLLLKASEDIALTTEYRLGHLNEVIYAYTFTHDYYFMAGDNAISSIDSRFWGLVPDNYIVGRVWRIWKSVDRKGKVRWDRIGMKV